MTSNNQTKLEALKTALDNANRDYQFALAAGDLQAVKRTQNIWNLAFAEYNKVKRAEFKKSFKSTVGS